MLEGVESAYNVLEMALHEKAFTLALQECEFEQLELKCTVAECHVLTSQMFSCDLKGVF